MPPVGTTDMADAICAALRAQKLFRTSKKPPDPMARGRLAPTLRAGSFHTLLLGQFDRSHNRDTHRTDGEVDRRVVD